MKSANRIAVLGLVASLVGFVACGDSGDGTGGSSSASNTSATSATGSQASTGTGADCQATCETTHAAGYALLSQLVVESCGCSASTTVPAPCKSDCMSDPACTDNMPNMGTPVMGSACETCILAEGDKGASSQCAGTAAFGMDCQNDTDCKELVMCVTACLGG
jgi:hypothetical protein